MRSAIVLCMLVLSIFTAGCVRSRTQCQNMVKAINEQPVLTGYSKTHIMAEFGPPELQEKLTSEGVKTEIWTYKTNFNDRCRIVNVSPVKTKYMKIVFADGRVLKADFE